MTPDTYERILFEDLLHLAGKTVKAAAHVGRPGGKPNAGAGRR